MPSLKSVQATIKRLKAQFQDELEPFMSSYVHGQAGAIDDGAIHYDGQPKDNRPGFVKKDDQDFGQP
jgi:hypothetical protein